MMKEAKMRDLTPDLRQRFAAIADHLIPACGKMPSASSVGIAGAVLDQVVQARPDLLTPIVRGLRACEGMAGAAAAESLHHDDPEAFDALSTAASGGYLMQPVVRELIGYPGQERVESPDPYATPSYVTDGTLKRVFDRGPVYVPTPGRKREAHGGTIAKDLK